MKNNEMVIRKAAVKDLKSIAEIFRIESAKPPYNKKRTPKSALEIIKTDFKENDMYVSIVNNKVVGFVMVMLDSGIKDQLWINEIWILRDYQGQGVGKSLMSRIEKSYKEKGISIFKLVAHTQRGGAVDFYKKLKYHIDNSMVYMEKRLK